MTINEDLAQPRAKLKGGTPALVVAFSRRPPAPPAPPDVDPSSPSDDPAQFGPSNPFRFSDLSRGDLSDDLYALKRETYRAHVTRSSRTREFVGTLRSDQLGAVHGSSHRLFKPSAKAANDLLTQAARDLAEDQARGDDDAMQTRKLGVCSTYRSANTQFGLWDKRFHMYLHAFCEADGLPVEANAVDPSKLAQYIGARTACPGYSHHQSGLAIDFATTVGNAELRAGSRDLWTRSWFYQWLQVHASKYGFSPLSGEPWHWTHAGGES